MDKSRQLIFKVLEQAIRDFINLGKSTKIADKENWRSAACMLFEDNYRLQWGSLELSLKDILYLLEIDEDRFNNKILVGVIREYNKKIVKKKK